MKNVITNLAHGLALGCFCLMLLGQSPLIAQLSPQSIRVGAQFGVSLMKSEVEDPQQQVVGGWFPIHTQHIWVAYDLASPKRERSMRTSSWQVELGVKRSAMAFYVYPKALSYFSGLGDQGSNFIGPSLGLSYSWPCGRKSWLTVYGRGLLLFSLDRPYPDTRQWGQTNYGIDSVTTLQLGAETKLLKRVLPGAQFGVSFCAPIFRHNIFFTGSVGGGTGFRRVYRQDLQYREVGATVGATQYATTWFQWTHLESMVGLQIRLPAGPFN
jgi:hypothetical protein